MQAARARPADGLVNMRTYLQLCLSDRCVGGKMSLARACGCACGRPWVRRVCSNGLSLTPCRENIHNTQPVRAARSLPCGERRAACAYLPVRACVRGVYSCPTLTVVLSLQHVPCLCGERRARAGGGAVRGSRLRNGSNGRPRAGPRPHAGASYSREQCLSGALARLVYACWW